MLIANDILSATLTEKSGDTPHSHRSEYSSSDDGTSQEVDPEPETEDNAAKPPALEPPISTSISAQVSPRTTTTTITRPPPNSPVVAIAARSLEPEPNRDTTTPSMCLTLPKRSSMPSISMTCPDSETIALSRSRIQPLHATSVPSTPIKTERRVNPEEAANSPNLSDSMKGSLNTSQTPYPLKRRPSGYADTAHPESEADEKLPEIEVKSAPGPKKRERKASESKQKRKDSNAYAKSRMLHPDPKGKAQDEGESKNEEDGSNFSGSFEGTPNTRRRKPSKKMDKESKLLYEARSLGSITYLHYSQLPSSHWPGYTFLSHVKKNVTYVYNLKVVLISFILLSGLAIYLSGRIGVLEEKLIQRNGEERLTPEAQEKVASGSGSY